MERSPANVVLIGMPGSGKSTIGVILAKLLSLAFVDTDVLIQIREGRSLQTIVDTDGYLTLRAIEEQILLSLELTGHVIATGGSAAYSETAMRHLGRSGTIVFLEVDFDLLLKRIDNFGERGIARRPDQTFRELFDERHELYCRHADVTVKCGAMSQEQVAQTIRERLA